jgi:lysophospholipase L1-like esterase
MAENSGFPKRTILCYGDSNVWGFVPGSNVERYPPAVRWTGVLARLLGNSIRVLEEGLRGRSAISDDPIVSANGIECNGFKTLGAILGSHAPLDLVVIMLGTYDLRRSTRLSAYDIADGVAALANQARNIRFGPGSAEPPEVMVICPPPIWEMNSGFALRFRGGRETSEELRPAFRRMALSNNLPVIYAEDSLQSDPADGINFSPAGHAALGEAVASWILEQSSLVTC